MICLLGPWNRKTRDSRWRCSWRWCR